MKVFSTTTFWPFVLLDFWPIAYPHNNRLRQLAPQYGLNTTDGVNTQIRGSITTLISRQLHHLSCTPPVVVVWRCLLYLIKVQAATIISTYGPYTGCRFRR